MSHKLVAIFLILLAATTLEAAQSSFHWEAGARAGYRQDYLSYTLYEETALKDKFFHENFKAIGGPQVEAFASFLFYYLQLGLDGDYTWIKRGHVKSRVWVNGAILPGTSQVIPASFKSDADGELWDGYARAKIHFPLYCRGSTKFALIPEGGYSFHHQSIKREDSRPESVDVAPLLVFDTAVLSTNLSKRLERWSWGPYVGGNILWETCDFFLEGGYSYHWLDLEQKLKITNTLQLSSSLLAISSGLVITDTDKLKVFRNIGHRGWLTLAYRVPCLGRIGVRGTYFLNNTPRRPSASTSEEVRALTTPPSPTIVTTKEQRPDIKTNWESFSLLLEMAFAY
ncbi:MAG: hypothetical protein K940chlam2_00566 [Chlamydiae bacterium]|nr:hypothetical protein [Chlamydiota bacterium]